MQKATLIVMALFILMGCTIMQMQEENKETEARIAQKEAQLSDLEAERERLAEYQAQLVKKLDQTKLTAQQLYDELDQLIRQNRQLVAAAEKQGQEVAQIKQEISALEAQQSSLSQLTASGESDAAKKQEIQELQQEIRNYLMLGLKSKHRKSLQ